MSSHGLTATRRRRGLAVDDGEGRAVAFVPLGAMEALGGADRALAAVVAAWEWATEMARFPGPARSLCLWASRDAEGRRVWRIGDMEGSGETLASLPRRRLALGPPTAVSETLCLLDAVAARAHASVRARTMPWGPGPCGGR